MLTSQLGKLRFRDDKPLVRCLSISKRQSQGLNPGLPHSRALTWFEQAEEGVGEPSSQGAKLEGSPRGCSVPCPEPAVSAAVPCPTYPLGG